MSEEGPSTYDDEHDPCLLLCSCPKCKKVVRPKPVVTPAMRQRDEAMRLRSEELQKKEDEKSAKAAVKAAKKKKLSTKASKTTATTSVNGEAT